MISFMVCVFDYKNVFLCCSNIYNFVRYKVMITIASITMSAGIKISIDCLKINKQNRISVFVSVGLFPITFTPGEQSFRGPNWKSRGVSWEPSFLVTVKLKFLASSLWDCPKICSDSQAVSYVLWISKCPKGKSGMLSGSLLCASLLPEISILQILPALVPSGRDLKYFIQLFWLW